MMSLATLCLVSGVLGMDALDEPATPVDPAPAPLTYVDYGFCGDHSGSMGSFGSSVREACQGYLTDIRDAIPEHPGAQTYVEFTVFGSTASTPFQGAATELDDATVTRCCDSMRPDSMTRLYDTAAESIRRQAARIQGHLVDGILPTHQKATFTLLTDGSDNESTELSGPAGERHLKALVAEHRAKGVVCFFMAANMNALQVGERFGFDPELCITLSSGYQGGEGGGEALRGAMSRMRGGGDVRFTTSERGRAARQDAPDASALVGRHAQRGGYSAAAPVAPAPVPVWEVDLGAMNGAENWQPINTAAGPSLEELSAMDQAARPEFVTRFGDYYLRAGGFGHDGVGYPNAAWHQVAKDDADRGISFYDNARMRQVRRTLQPAPLA